MPPEYDAVYDEDDSPWEDCVEDFPADDINEIPLPIEFIPTNRLAAELMRRSDEFIMIRYRQSPGDHEPPFDILCSWDFPVLVQMCGTAAALLSTSTPRRPPPDHSL